MTTPSAPAKYRLDLGDGTFIESDMPSKSILRATKRMGDALAKGREPRLEDARKLLLWLDEQQGKYGGIKPGR